MLYRLGRWSSRRHRWVIAAWVLAVVAVGAVEGAHHGTQVDHFAIPGTPSQKAADLLEQSFPSATGTSALVVFRAPEGTLRDPRFAAALAETTRRLSRLPHANTVLSPLTPVPTGISDGGPATGTPNLSEKDTVGYASVQFSDSPGPVPAWKSLYRAIESAAQPARSAGITVLVGGQVADVGDPLPPGLSKYSEEIGLVAALVVLLVALGSAVSMVIPIGIGIVAVALSTTIVDIASASMSIGTVAPILGSMIGLGVGIDYSLFVLGRFRQELHAGDVSADEASGRAVQTSGSAVLFAGVTVCIALCGLAIVQIPYVSQLGFVASMYVAVTLLAALTLLPALLGALGTKVDAGQVHRKRGEHAAPASRSAASPGSAGEDRAGASPGSAGEGPAGASPGPADGGLSGRWAAGVARRPKLTAAAALVLLGALALPLSTIRLGFTDDGNLPVTTEQRQAYDAIAKAFGPGVNSPLVVAVRLPSVTRSTGLPLVSAVTHLLTSIRSAPHVASVSLPIPNKSLPFVLKPGAPPGSTDPADFTYDFAPDKQPSALLVRVVPSTAPNDPATSALVANLRNRVIPNSLKGSVLPSSQVFVGGQTAVLIDLTDAISARLAMFIATVVVLATLLLMMVFRSVAIPVNAAFMNLVSIVAAYGIIVAVFQHGIGAGLLGLTGTIPIVAFVPVMMFAILFGLSMDYEVFLLSKIKEEFVASGDPSGSVAAGLAQTARVITAAALIMISVFLAFVPNPNPTVKLIGFGMAAAVLLDATIVRMMLVPATMELTGRLNWKFPRFLDRLLPKITVD